MSVYILRCQNDKYYVGYTTDLNRRFEQHLDLAQEGQGAKFTQKYKPIEVLEVHPGCDTFDEDKYVKIMMAKYGIDNVRGGSYSQLKLASHTMELLAKEIRGGTGGCFACGSEDHWVKDCPAQNKEVCQRCGRNTHSAGNCYAKTTLDGQVIDKPGKKKGKKKGQVCQRCGRNTHTKASCYAKTTVDGQVIDEPVTPKASQAYKPAKGKGVVCQRCGRDTHSAKINCFAKTTVDGLPIIDPKNNFPAKDEPKEGSSCIIS